MAIPNSSNLTERPCSAGVEPETPCETGMSFSLKLSFKIVYILGFIVYNTVNDKVVFLGGHAGLGHTW